MKIGRIKQLSVILVILALVIGLISPVYGAGLVLDETEADTYEGTDAYAGDFDLQEFPAIRISNTGTGSLRKALSRPTKKPTKKCC